MVKEKISKVTKRHLEVLGRYHEIDEENKIIKVTLHYEKVSEILVPDMGDKEHPAFGRPLVDRMTSLLDTFPYRYKLDVKFQINDYEGYDPQVINSAFSNYLELEHYRSQREIKRMFLFVALLAFIGVALLVIVTLFKRSPSHQDSLIDHVFDYFGETCACVFMWESCSQLFLYPAPFLKTNNKIFNLFYAVSFLDGNGQVLAHSEKKDVFKDLVFYDSKKKTGNILLIAAGSVQIMLGVVGIINFFVDVSKQSFTQQQIIVNSILACLVAATQIFLGIASINQFRLRGPFIKWVAPLAIFLLVLFCGYLATFIIASQAGLAISPAMIVGFVVGIINTVATLVGSILAKPSPEEI